MDFGSLCEHDAGYYQFPSGGWWLPGEYTENGLFRCSRKSVEVAVNVDLDDSDILIASYMKTGIYHMGLVFSKSLFFENLCSINLSHMNTLTDINAIHSEIKSLSL